jgi:hypothetical protein
MDKDMQPVMTEWADGVKEWRLNGKFHRTDGPALEYADGRKDWVLHGEFHREDGPAIEDANGVNSWYLHGKYLKFDEWLEENTEISDDEKVMLKLQYG